MQRLARDIHELTSKFIIFNLTITFKLHPKSNVEIVVLRTFLVHELIGKALQNAAFSEPRANGKNMYQGMEFSSRRWGPSSAKMVISCIYRYYAALKKHSDWMVQVT